MTKKGLQIATIFNAKKNNYEVEVDGQLVAEFSDKIQAQSHAQVLSFMYDMGYEEKEENSEVLEDVYFNYELPDDVRFKNNFAGK